MKQLCALLLGVSVGLSGCWSNGLWAEDSSDDIMAGLPELPTAEPRPAELPADMADLTPGIAINADHVVLQGVTLFESGPVDGLEVLACLDGGKAHESLVRLMTGNGQSLKFAMIRALGVDDGVPAPEMSGFPARGWPIRIQLQWQSANAADTWVAVDASQLVRDRMTDRPFPAVPYIYTGSRIVAVPHVNADGQTVKRNRFMLDTTKSVAVNFDEPDALIASPYVGAETDSRFEVYSGIAPRAQSECRLVLTRAHLPLTLIMDAQGGLHQQADGPVMTDAQVDAVLVATYPASYEGLRAVAVHVQAAETPREVDVAVRKRLLERAAAAHVWVIPVFVPSPSIAAP